MAVGHCAPLEEPKIPSLLQNRVVGSGRIRSEKRKQSMYFRKRTF